MLIGRDVDLFPDQDNDYGSLQKYDAGGRSLLPGAQL
jgi:hypothetical protein